MTTITIPFARLGGDIQTREHQGRTFGTFSIAVDQGYDTNKRTIWYECIGSAEILERMTKAGAKKGSTISLVGTLTFQEGTKRDGTKGDFPKIRILAWDYTKGGFKKDEDSGNTTPSTPPSNPTPPQSSNGFGQEANLDDDDLPF